MLHSPDASNRGNLVSRILSGSIADSPSLAVGLMLSALIMLSAQDALVKLVSEDTTLWQFQIIRALINLILLAGVANWMMSGQVLRPKSYQAILLRSIFHVGALSFFFSGVPHLTLAEMAGGLYTFPLFVVLLGFLVAGERVGPWRMIAVCAGFMGTLLILKPGTDSFRLAGLLPVCAGFCYGCFVVTTRKFCRGESPIILVLGSNLMIILVGLIGWWVVVSLPLTDAMRQTNLFLLGPSLSMTAGVLGIIGICGVLNTAANLFLGKAYQSADSSFLAPVDYSYLIFATFWGYVFWNDLPSMSTIVGMCLITTAGIVVAWRERKVSGP